MNDEAWFSALGDPLADEERSEIAAYLAGLAMNPALVVHTAATWLEAEEICKRPAEAWWRAEEVERQRLENAVRPNPGVYQERFAIF